MPPDPIASAQQDPDAPGVAVSRGADAPGFPTLEAAIAEVRALRPAWPATLVREVAGRLVGILAAARNPDPPPARVLTSLGSVISPGAMRDAATQPDGHGDAP